ncbi:hypothetical protein TELCIR_14929 [Teladorsagia circumcincta]|uniref:GH18 domain-containing protein n=1 Tax=Teladorsagia circumcincta TaxID=45464 RepID=A0A2G9U1U2_TELCI|nr:hypothetical protein TELCIR_14929 [Teladorsagia circumcincta]
MSSLQHDDPKGKCGAGSYPSHTMIGKLNDDVDLSPSVSNLIDRINQWIQDSEERPPKIILLIGARQGNDVWRRALGSPIKRKLLVANIVRRGVLPGLSNRRDMESVSDFVILHTHRLHSYHPTFTGHHSPMFPGTALPDSRMTVESFVKDWISRGVPREKLIVSITTVPTWSTLKDAWDGSGEVFGRPVDLSASPTQKSEISSQTEICRALEKNTTLSRWVHDSSVPVQVRGKEFIAFENEKSIKIKTTWSSLNNLGAQRLSPETIPFERCSGVVVEHAEIDSNSSIHFVSKEHEEVAEELDTIIHRWESSGLMRSKILLQIPSYGMEQLLVNRSDVGIGRPTEKEYAVMGQAELCQRLKYAGTVRQTHWDSMSVNAWTTGGRWISIDDQHTVKYKVKSCSFPITATQEKNRKAAKQ